jgi:Mg-chelatase subunit ChlD
MTLAAPWALLWGLLAIPVIAVHMLKPKRLSVVISSVLQWRSVATPVSSAAPWQRLRITLPLLLQVLAIALFAIGAAGPTLSQPAPYGRHTVFLIDVSASMGARIDAEPDASTRLDDAIRAAITVRKDLPSNALASIVTVEAQPRVVLSASESSSAFRSQLRRLEARPGRPDVAAAALLAQGLQSVSADTSYVLISDGDFDETQRRQFPAIKRFRQVGTRADNLSIDGLTVQRAGSTGRATATIRNHGATRPAGAPSEPVAATAVTISFEVDGKAGTKRALTLKPGEDRLITVDVAAGDRVTAKLTGTRAEGSNPATADQFGGDDQRFVVVADRPESQVLLVSPGDSGSVFIERALRALPGVKVTVVDKVPKSSGTSATPATSADIIVLDRVGVEQDSRIDAPVLAIAPPEGLGSIDVTGNETDVAATAITTTDPLFAGLDLSGLYVSNTQQLVAPDAEVLVSGVRAPLVLRGRVNRQPMVYLGFAIDESTLPLDIGFPVMVDRAVRELSGAASAGFEIAAGDPFPIEQNDLISVTTPSGRVLDASAGNSVTADEVGFWTASRGDGTTATFAVNEASSESELRIGTVPEDGANGPLSSSGNRTQRSILHWVLGALVLVGLAEWLSVRKRRGVSPSQWSAARALRVIVGALIIGALIAPTFTRSTDQIAVVFAVDASDSLGPAGRREAVDAVQKALAGLPTSARAGVVVFGGSARVTAATQRDLELGSSLATVDGSRTDLAGALRLAGAITPNDAARRVVLVSDGRRTTGDEVTAAEELSAQNIRLDAIAVGRPVAGDIAVTEFTGPNRARPGETVDLRVRVESQSTGALARSTEIVVTSGTSEVARKTVELEPGPNEFVFTVTTPTDATGVLPFAVRVGESSDAVPENDSARAVVTVESPVKVLILDGDTAGGTGADLLAGALTKKALDTTVTRIGDIPGLTELSTYAAIVMVDVHLRDLTDQSVQELTSAVRELGVGLVVVGGTNSYGSGGYLGTEFEDVLPVVSDVDDPIRRKPIAQVIVIDVSGSMAELVDGTRSKLDLAKAAALGSITTLNEGDRIGILAVDDGSKWIMNVRDRPTDKEARDELRRLRIGGGTDLAGSLTKAAKQLESSPDSIRNVIMLTDGYTSGPMADIEAEAKKLRAQGITVSVVGAGADVEPTLPNVAATGGGRYIPGKDFRDLPRLFVAETEVVQRNLVSEGNFEPTVTSGAAVVRSLRAAPAIQGYQATTAKPTARTLLTVGDEQDPLLATWQAGSGRVTSWTSDGGQRWSTAWVQSEAMANYWSAVVKDVFSPKRPGLVRAVVRDDRLQIRADGDLALADGAKAVATVSGPTGRREITLSRAADGSYVGETELNQSGSFAIGVSSVISGRATPLGETIAVRSYSSEYRPRPVERDRLAALSKRTGGRGLITPEAAFASGGLRPGERTTTFDRRHVPVLALLSLLAIALSRIAVGRRLARLFGRVRVPLPKRAKSSTEERTLKTARSSKRTSDPVARPVDEPAAPKPPPVAPSLGQLLDRAREERERR